MAKTNTYHKSASWTCHGEKQSYNTQEYSVGIYAIFDNNPSRQVVFTLKEIRRFERELEAKSKFQNPDIENLEFGKLVEVA
jgi:hypothetical protein